MLETINLCKQFGETQALRDVNLKVEPGEIYCLLGANGAGKTTLDISALCKLTKNIDIGLRVRNITDELYAQWYYSEQVLIADPRTYELSLHMRF